MTISILILFLLSFPLALVVHEAGHYAAARLLGYPARLIFCRKGPGIEWGTNERISPPGDRFAVAAAGPGVSMLAGGLMMVAGVEWGSIVGIVGLMQLLPLPHSDGMVMWGVLRGRR